MNTIRSCPWISLLPLISWSACGQGLSGKVVDAQTGHPVPYASVSLIGTTQGTSSNVEGEFELPGAKLPGRLVVSELSHRTDTVAAADTQPLLVRLQPTTVTLPEVQLGSYTAELIKKAYRQLQRSNAHKTYADAFYRQITRIDNDPTEVQEMIWNAKTDNAGMLGTNMAQARYAKKKALLSFNNFSMFTRANRMLGTGDSAASRSVLSPNVDQYFTLNLLSITQNGSQQLAEISFAARADVNPDKEQGSLVIDTDTYQILRLRRQIMVKATTNNPLFRLKDGVMYLEWSFKPGADSSTELDLIKTSYLVTATRPLKPDLKIEVVAFTSFYDKQSTPVPGLTYAPPTTGITDLAAVKATAYDPAFWRTSSAVKRTPLEEEIITSFEQKGAFGTMLTP